MIELDLTLKEQLSMDFESDPIICNLDKIRSGESIFTDEDFDKVLPKYYQFCSAIHWTSFKVANVIAEWLQACPNKKFIDIGCGIGKVCFFLGLRTTLSINGIEQRKHLVDIANKIITTNKILSINVFHGNVLDLNWDDYDVYYFYNPFHENVFDVDLLQIDTRIKFSKEKFYTYTFFVFETLDKLPVGKTIITYHGFGKAPPPTWKLIKSKLIGGGFLEWWEKIQ